MGYKIVINTEDFELIPNDSHLENHNLTYSFVNSAGNHLNFFLPPISGLTETQLKMTISIFSEKIDKMSLFILANKSDYINDKQQIFTENTPESTIEIKIENEIWVIKSEHKAENFPLTQEKEINL